MLLLNATDLKKTFSGETLFEDVSFNVYSSDKIGFVGVNGAGKSTLFKIITGITESDSGEISKSREVKIGYLEQYTVCAEGTTVMDEMLSVFSQVIETEQQLESIRLEMETAGKNIDELVSRQAALQERFIALDGMYYKSKIKSALIGLGFSQEDFYTPMDKLSGGQKTRIALCKILLSNANLLLLDEPTNHLDIDSVEWLEDFLINYKGTFIVISHDRYFLDKVTTKTFELENKHFRSYNGNYSAYIAQREIEKLTCERNYDYTVREIHRLEEVVEQQRRWKHKKNKKTHTLDNTRKAIERLEKTLVEPDRSPDSMKFSYKACPGGAQRVLETKDLGISFGENKLFGNVDMLIKKGERVFLLGANGCGKTTLIKIIMGIYSQSCGEYKIGDNIRVGYYDQLKENLSREKTVIDEVWDEHPEMTHTQIRNALAMFLFRGDDVFKSVSSLSGGELARVELTKLMLNSVNFLIMDEPTNHLDILSREALEKALTDYDATMLMVSHDRYFINKLAQRILYLNEDGITEYTGNYDDFICARKAAQDVSRPQSSVPDKARDYREQKRLEAQKRKTLNRFSKVEGLIEETENKIKELRYAYEDPSVAADYVKLSEISSQIDELNFTLDAYMEEWEALQQTIDDMGYAQ